MVAAVCCGCTLATCSSVMAASRERSVCRFSPMYVSGPYHTCSPGTWVGGLKWSGSEGRGG